MDNLHNDIEQLESQLTAAREEIERWKNAYAEARKTVEFYGPVVDDKNIQLTAAKEKIEQLQVQLAGCSVAALGGTDDPAKVGDYGWSASYEDVLNLRSQLQKLQKELRWWKKEFGRES